MVTDKKKTAIRALRKKKWGYKKIANKLRLNRDQVRDYLRSKTARKAMRKKR